MDKDTTAERIRRERERRGQSREEVAAAAGISFGQVRRWETGDAEPRGTNLRRLAEFWEIPMSDLRPDPEVERSEVIVRLERVEEMLRDCLDRLEEPPGGELEVRPLIGPLPAFFGDGDG